MIEYQIGIHLQPECVSRLDQVEQFCFGTEPRRHAAFLIELAQVIEVVGIVAHRFPSGGFVCGRKPQRSETGFRDGRQF